ncbi:hypothetical protein I3842_09G153200 [Carya illinoinensis]|uniref:Uncharacterized protein n=1 Tax=Carya illinoinensis TaxID=32201 RepID=A0A922J826_CARIL|nr:hypothetical protein I3842_09G153200 [Carya illinoinensis]
MCENCFNLMVISWQKLSTKNRESRKRLVINHTAGRKSFVRILEEKKDMVSKLDTLEPEQRTEERIAGVFREVLVHRPGYARGLEEMIILESTRQRTLAREKEYLDLIEKHKKEAESSKSEMEAMKANMQLLLERRAETDRLLRAFFAANPTPLSESQRETQ